MGSSAIFIPTRLAQGGLLTAELRLVYFRNVDGIEALQP
jgi:hypothetical protein